MTEAGNLEDWTHSHQSEMGQIISWVAAGFMMFGGILPYIPQYLEIRKSRNTDGFSLYVCFTLLVANTLRIMFWFGHPFETPLLLQSIFMIGGMFLMVHLCTSVNASNEIIASKSRRFTDSKESIDGEEEIKYSPQPKTLFDFDMQWFWKWTDFASYVQFMLVLTAAAGLVTYTLQMVPLYVEVLGFCALLTEAVLAMPQFYRNMKNRSTMGMSLIMVLGWTTGDIFKTIYFLLRDSPLQFSICGSFQVAIDFLILGQVFYYGNTVTPLHR